MRMKQIAPYFAPPLAIVGFIAAVGWITRSEVMIGGCALGATVTVLVGLVTFMACQKGHDKSDQMKKLIVQYWSVPIGAISFGIALTTSNQMLAFITVIVAFFVLLYLTQDYDATLLRRTKDEIDCDKELLVAALRNCIDWIKAIEGFGALSQSAMEGRNFALTAVQEALELLQKPAAKLAETLPPITFCTQFRDPYNPSSVFMVEFQTSITKLESAVLGLKTGRAGEERMKP